jgi:hypothetical protein
MYVVHKKGNKVNEKKKIRKRSIKKSFNLLVFPITHSQWTEMLKTVVF